MRVLSIGFMYPPDDLGGGYELTWRSAVRSMRRRGERVRVLASDWSSPDRQEGARSDDDVHRELRVYWDQHRFPRLGPRARLAIERDNAAVLERHLEELRPEVVNWWAMGGMSLSLVEQVRRAGVPAVGVVGDDWLNWGPRADAWVRPFRGRPRTAKAVERLTGIPAQVDLGGAALWLFNSERMRASALAAQPELERVAVAHPGIDADLFRPAPPRPWEWRLLCLGRMDPRKGTHIAVEAMAHLPPQATLVLQGEGDPDYVAQLRDSVARLRLERRVSFSRQPRESLPAVYADADAILFPVQWEEPWGLVPLESMAVGRPVVATGTGGSAEYLRDGDNCLLFQPRDRARELAVAVRRLAQSPELRTRLRAGGASTAARFTESAYNEAIHAALTEAANSARAAAPRPRQPA